MSDDNASAPNLGLPPIHWVDTNQVPRDPVPSETLIGWIDAGHLPADTPAWWEGRDGWTTAIELRRVIATTAALASSEGDTPVAPLEETQPTAEGTQPTAGETQPTAVTAAEPTGIESPAPAEPERSEPPSPETDPMSTASLTAEFEDQDLDDTFIEMVERSSEIYGASERATTIDQVFLGGVIASFGDSGFVLIDIHTGGSVRGIGSAAPVALPANRHELRFEEPASGARVALLLEHLTPDAGSDDEPAQLARIELGYGQRVPDSGQVARALHQEMASTFVVSPEPGRLTFDADTSSGFVYCQVDLLWELDRYVDDSMDVDADLLRKHLAATVHTLRKFLQLRFGS